ncbi:unnamed protein product [Caenorhabditis sp. 36 PRJEB53466]|nr:unnamed protein product [Caenorhabditis sp. 36 PRJEB53466]
MGDETKIDIIEFLKRHLSVKNWLNYREQPYTKGEVIQVIDMAMEIFKTEPILATSMPPCTIVGDIHGQYCDLVRLLNSKGNKKLRGFAQNQWVFLGDYVDRGSHSLECICLMFGLKVAYPTQYTLLRGNHETRAINFAYGFREELSNRFGDLDGPEVWEKFNEVFSWMPLACLVGNKILCMHGGIGPDLKSLDDIRKLKRPITQVATCRLAQDLLWSDPLEGGTMPMIGSEPIFGKNAVRGLSCTFNDAAVLDVCNRLKIDLIVRAHQMIPEGFKFYADRHLLTIFSAPRYQNEVDNKGSYLKVEKSGKVSISIMRNTKPFQGKQPVPASQDEPTVGGDENPAARRKKSDTKTARSASAKSTTSSSTSG